MRLQWDTVCDDAYKVSTSQTILTGGFLLGAFVVSPVIDRFGRKRVMLFSIIIVSILEFCAAWVKHYWLFCVFKFGIGFVQQVSNVMLLSTISTCSWVHRKHFDVLVQEKSNFIANVSLVLTHKFVNVAKRRKQWFTKIYNETMNNITNIAILWHPRLTYGM